MSWLTIWKPLPPAIDAWTTNADRLVEMASKIPGQLWHQGWLASTGQVFVPEARRILTAIETVVVASDFLHSGCDVRSLLTECMTIVSNITTPLDVLNFAMRLRHLAGLLAQAALDSDTPRRNRVERALEHLNRSLVVDDVLRSRWVTALAEGETTCERLGAVHLLGHGVSAFKVNAAGGRTDLVLSGELEVTPAVVGSDALVLTEWKVVRDGVNVAMLARAAREQTKLYAVGVLVGVEVSSARFIVLVSERRLPDSVPDLLEGPILYRHFNIVVRAETPSIASTRS